MSPDEVIAGPRTQTVAPAAADRRLVAIVLADVVGYSRLVAADPEGTVARLRELRREVIEPGIAGQGGRLIHTAGDCTLATFGSIMAAVRFGLALQAAAQARAANLPPQQRIALRIGVEIGDVLADSGDIHGDGVNVAARLQAACPVGGLCVSGAVRDHVRDRIDLAFESLGTLQLRNISRPVPAWVLRPALAPRSVLRWRRPSVRRLGVAGLLALPLVAAGLLASLRPADAPLAVPAGGGPDVWKGYGELGERMLLAGQDRDAVLWLRRALDGDRVLEPARRSRLHLMLAAALDGSGHAAAARAAVEEANRIFPYWTVRWIGMAVDSTDNPTWVAQWRRVLDALRRLGLRDHVDEHAPTDVPDDSGMQPANRSVGPTPLRAPGATTVLTEDLVRLIADRRPVILATHYGSRSVPGAIRIWPNPAGHGTDFTREALARRMAILTRGNLAHPIVVLGYNAEHWYPRNLVLRLVALGYGDVHWYRGGREAWEAHGLPEELLTVQEP